MMRAPHGRSSDEPCPAAHTQQSYLQDNRSHRSNRPARRGSVFYVFVLRSISHFVDDQIQESLVNMSHDHLYDMREGVQ